MSWDVTARLTGGANLMPLFRWNVYVLPPFVAFGRAVAMSGTSLFPAAPLTWL
jgi:hypothetical protein